MGEKIYNMSKEFYNELRYQKVWNPKTKQMEIAKNKKPLSKKEVIELINNQFGLLGKVIEINFV